MSPGEPFFPFDKKSQAKKIKRKEKIGLTRKEQRSKDRSDKYLEKDYAVYNEVKNRAFDWTLGGYCCEICKEEIGDGGAMHHIIHRSQLGETSKSNLYYLCVPCHQREHGTRRD